MTDQDNTLDMVDILPWQTLNASSNSLLIGAIILAGVFFTLVVIWRWYNQPLKKLHRQLLKQQLSPRQVANELARVVNVSDVHLQALQALRFARQAPSVQQVAAMIRAMRDE